jgi:hypothetical protein
VPGNGAPLVATKQQHARTETASVGGQPAGRKGCYVLVQGVVRVWHGEGVMSLLIAYCGWLFESETTPEAMRARMTCLVPQPAED